MKGVLPSKPTELQNICGCEMECFVLEEGDLVYGGDKENRRKIGEYVCKILFLVLKKKT